MSFHDLKQRKFKALFLTILNKIHETQSLTEELISNKKQSFHSLIIPLQISKQSLSTKWSEFNHLFNVMYEENFSGMYQEALEKLTQFETEQNQNVKLYNAFLAIKKNEYKSLSNEALRAIELELKNFELAGIHLAMETREKIKHLEIELAQLESTFEQNLLQIKLIWTLDIAREKQLKGLPKNMISAAKRRAYQKQFKGWSFELNASNYESIMNLADDAKLRKEMYKAFHSRGSNLALHDQKYNNSNIMLKILSKRQALAKLLNYNTFANYSLASKMVKKPQDIFVFLNNLAKQAKKTALKEKNELKNFIEKLEPGRKVRFYDWAYFGEKFYQHRFQLNQALLRTYFPLPSVLKGCVQLIQNLFQIKLKPLTKVGYHSCLLYYQVIDNSGVMRGELILDLVSRSSKREGAWMASAQDRLRLNNRYQIPKAYIVCNFPDGNPSLLNLDEVETLLHELGHALQHVLTLVDIPSLAGGNGVPWDAIEFPSQFLEKWLFDAATLKLLSCHIKTQMPLSDNLINKIIQSKNDRCGMQICRQIEFALFDLTIHNSDISQVEDIKNILSAIRKNVAISKATKYNVYQNNFSHIFAGAYAAGYYSYLWAEVLALDAFRAFKEGERQVLGEKFRQTILEKGGSIEAMALFEEFRGRAPQIKAFLNEKLNLV